MQVRLNVAMSTRPLNTLGARLSHARDQRKLTQTQLANLAELKQSDISKLERGGMLKTTGIARLANALRVHPMWLETGDGPEPDWISAQHANRGLAQNLSQARPTLSLSKVTWEELQMGLTPNQPFELDVNDDALAPDIFAGCVAMLDPQRPPEPAWPVLVKDKHGGVYLRDYEAGPGNTWRAVARARGFRPLDSEADGLTILAAMDGYRRPRR